MRRMQDKAVQLCRMLIAFLVCVWGQSSAAATIEMLSERNEFSCDIMLTGEIAKGDSARLTQIQDKIWPGDSGANEGPGDGGNLCLDIFV